MINNRISLLMKNRGSVVAQRPEGLAARLNDKQRRMMTAPKIANKGKAQNKLNIALNIAQNMREAASSNLPWKMIYAEKDIEVAQAMKEQFIASMHVLFHKDRDKWIDIMGSEPKQGDLASSKSLRTAYFQTYAEEYESSGLIERVLFLPEIDPKEIAIFIDYCRATANRRDCGHKRFDAVASGMRVGAVVLQAGSQGIGADMIFSYKMKNVFITTDMVDHGDEAAYKARALTIYMDHLDRMPEIRSLETLFFKIERFICDRLKLSGQISIKVVNDNKLITFGGHCGGGMYYFDSRTGELSEVFSSTGNLQPTFKQLREELAAGTDIKPIPGVTPRRHKLELKEGDRVIDVSDGYVGEGGVNQELFMSTLRAILVDRSDISTMDLSDLLRFVFAAKGVELDDDLMIFSTEYLKGKSLPLFRTLPLTHEEASKIIGMEEARSLISESALERIMVTEVETPEDPSNKKK